jgi:O-antigen ligase
VLNPRIPRLSRVHPVQALLFFTLGWLCFVDPIIIYKADISWYYAVCLFFPLAVLYTRRWVLSSFSEYICTVGLLIAMALGGILSGHTTKAVIYCAKLAFSLLFLWPLLRSNPGSLKWLIRGIATLVVANFSLFTLHLVAGLPTATRYAGDRWGTALSSMGILGVPGAFIFSYYLVRLIVTKLSLQGVFLAVAGLTISLASGSRGVTVLCLMALGAGGLAVFLGRPLSRLYRVTALSLLVCVALVLVARRQIVTSSVLTDRVSNFFETSTGIDDDSLNAEDPVRYKMVQLATEAIREHPIRGAGLLALGVPAEGGEILVIHNRYLGVWSELGALGFVSLLGIVLSWVPDLWRMMRRRRITLSVDDRFNLIWTSLALAQFLVFGMFFPMGVQISDWLIFLLAKAQFRRMAVAWRSTQKLRRAGDGRRAFTVVQVPAWPAEQIQSP